MNDFFKSVKIWQSYCQIVDDMTLSELLQYKHMVSQLSTFLTEMIHWAVENNMELNTYKTKEMILAPLA